LLERLAPKAGSVEGLFGSIANRPGEQLCRGLFFDAKAVDERAFATSARSRACTGGSNGALD
jgi:hypothetical protein